LRLIQAFYEENYNSFVSRQERKGSFLPSPGAHKGGGGENQISGFAMISKRVPVKSFKNKKGDEKTKGGLGVHMESTESAGCSSSRSEGYRVWKGLGQRGEWTYPICRGADSPRGDSVGTGGKKSFGGNKEKGQRRGKQCEPPQNTGEGKAAEQKLNFKAKSQLPTSPSICIIGASGDENAKGKNEGEPEGRVQASSVLFVADPKRNLVTRLGIQKKGYQSLHGDHSSNCRRVLLRGP